MRVGIDEIKSTIHDAFNYFIVGDHKNELRVDKHNHLGKSKFNIIGHYFRNLFRKTDEILEVHRIDQIGITALHALKNLDVGDDLGIHLSPEELRKFLEIAEKKALQFPIGSVDSQKWLDQKDKILHALNSKVINKFTKQITEKDKKKLDIDEHGVLSLISMFQFWKKDPYHKNPVKKAQIDSAIEHFF